MRELLHQYFNIAFLMGKPQDLPAGIEQMKVGVALAFVTYVVALAVPYGLIQGNFSGPDRPCLHCNDNACCFVGHGYEAAFRAGLWRLVWSFSIYQSGRSAIVRVATKWTGIADSISRQSG